MRYCLTASNPLIAVLLYHGARATGGLSIGRRYNKNVLKVFPYPITCTVLQFGVGSLLAITMWTLGLHPRPEISGETVTAAA